jgi:hypothetical protein
VNSNDFGGGGGEKGKVEGKKVDPFSHLNEDPVKVPVQKQMQAPSMGLGKEFSLVKIIRPAESYDGRDGSDGTDEFKPDDGPPKTNDGWDGRWAHESKPDNGRWADAPTA